MNLGLRFEREFANTERYNRSISGFDSVTPSPIAAQAQAAYALKPDVIPASQFKVLGGPLFPSASNPAIFTPQSKMFSPRLGFAWTPLGNKTVFRGGTGVFMFPVNNPSYNQPGFSQATSMVASLDSFLTPYATLANPFRDGFQQPTGSSLGLATNLGKSLSYYNPTIHNAYSVRWELSFQRELPGNMVLEMAYIGNHALHLLMDRNMDAVPAKYLSTSPTRDQATIDYLGLIVANPFAGLIPGQSLNGATVSRQTSAHSVPRVHRHHAARHQCRQLVLSQHGRTRGEAHVPWPVGTRQLHLLEADCARQLQERYRHAAGKTRRGRRPPTAPRPQWQLHSPLRQGYGGGPPFGHLEPDRGRMESQRHLREPGRRAAYLRQQPHLQRGRVEQQPAPGQSRRPHVRHHAIQYQQRATTGKQHQHRSGPGTGACARMEPPTWISR